LAIAKKKIHLKSDLFNGKLPTAAHYIHFFEICTHACISNKNKKNSLERNLDWVKVVSGSSSAKV